MIKYFLVVIAMSASSCFGQTYKAQLAEYRKTYMDDFLKESSSPLKKDDLQNLRFYEGDSTYRVIAKAELLFNEQTFLMPVFSGGGQQYVRYAVLKIFLKGKPVTLTVYRSPVLAKIDQYKDYLFLPFTDLTNGVSTYSGGRYIDLAEKDFKNGSVIIDFNKAYNPYCAYKSGYSCPKPPEANHMEMAVEAGEKQFAAEKMH